MNAYLHDSGRLADNRVPSTMQFWEIQFEINLMCGFNKKNISRMKKYLFITWPRKMKIKIGIALKTSLWVSISMLQIIFQNSWIVWIALKGTYNLI